MLRIAFVAAAFALTAVAACSPGNVAIPPGYEPILGSWRCQVNQDGLTVDSTTTYAPNGTFTGSARSTAAVPGRSVDVSATGTGRWKLEGNQFTETTDGFNLTSATLNGAPIDPNSVEGRQMKAGMDAMKGVAVTRTIESISQTALTVSYQGQQVTCTRS